jgi:hypothetical protein
VVDVDAMVRRTLAEEADDAPLAGSLLDAVHERARRKACRLRRIGAAATAVVAVAVLGAAMAVVAAGPSRHGPTKAPGPAGVPPIASAEASDGPSAVTSSPAGTGSAPASDGSVRLAPPAYRLPVFPFQPGTTPIGGLKPPVVTLDAGELVAYYEARDPVRGADVTIRVGPRRPTFGPGAAGPVREAARRVRGHPGTLRTVEVAPANQLSLYWPEAGQWVRVDTDDTLTDDEVVRFADALAPASVPVVAPFRFDLVPIGAVLDTATPSTVVLRAGQAAISCTLVAGRRSPGISRTSAGTTLTVALAGATVLVQVPARYPISDADLARFGAGVHVTDRAEPHPG